MWDSLLSFLFFEEKEMKKSVFLFVFFVICFCFVGFFFITSRVLSVVLNGQYCT